MRVFALSSLMVLAACPEEHEDPCEACTDEAQRTACLAIVRDDCEAFPEGTEEHESCEEGADDGCVAGDGEGEGE